MAIEKENIDALFSRLEDFEDTLKDTRALIKEAFETFAEQKEIDVKSIKKAYKEYKQLKKNKEEFELINAETSQIVELLTTEETAE